MRLFFIFRIEKQKIEFQLILFFGWRELIYYGEILSSICIFHNHYNNDAKVVLNIEFSQEKKFDHPFHLLRSTKMGSQPKLFKVGKRN